MASAAHAGRLEAGSFTTTRTTGGNNAPTPVSFQASFDTVPVVVAISDQRGNQSASIRITNITISGFDALVLEPDNFNGRHGAQTVQYIAIEPGRQILPGGTEIEAGFVNTSSVQLGPGVTGSASWTNVTFSSPLSASATVLSQIQTANSETRNVPSQSSRPHITAITNNGSASGFDVALERSQAAIGTPVSEQVGWIAFPSGSSDSFTDVAGITVNWGASNSGNSVRGWNDGCFATALPITSSTRIAVAKKRTRNNGDGGWLRYCSLSASTIGLRVEEDTDQDNERSVPAGQAESAAIVAFSRSFHANLRPAISVSKSSATQINSLGNDFAIPGTIVEYNITVTNSGTAPADKDSLIVTDILPDNVALIVNDIAGGGSGPVGYGGGIGSAGLVYSYAGLGNGSDSLSFSTDGTGYGYTPVAAGDGSDTDVTHFRVSPMGFLEGDRGSGAGSFTLTYRVIIE
ncbi:DUF11 domain-containing protein [Sphingorhabdus sp. Alg239-R122]|uniref:DUF11 domain-containing protein n=1 Tax=Sphingorhabdus sp. Alg239-R122 TaxID=2305989 RepID=UPI0013DD2298|nr:DUF11 domain-containing protein [Sphingorhabdus sp. Alg239-R122]